MSVSFRGSAALLATAFTVVMAAVPAAAQDASQAPTAGADQLEHVQIALWSPSPIYAGLYVARDAGYLADEGIELEIIYTQDSTDSLVGAGRVPFGASWQENITFARNEGVPVVSIASFLAHNTSAFVSAKSRDITRPADYAGKSYGGWGAPIEEAIIRALVRLDGGDPDSVNFVAIGGANTFEAIERDIDFAWIYAGWGEIQAQQAGQEINLQFLKDWDPVFDWYTPTIITNEQTIAERPDLVQGLVSAVARGYADVIADPTLGVEALLREAPDSDPALVQQSLAYHVDGIYQDDVPWGYQKPETWRDFSAWLEENAIIPVGFDYEAAFTNQFIDGVSPS